MKTLDLENIEYVKKDNLEKVSDSKIILDPE